LASDLFHQYLTRFSTRTEEPAYTAAAFVFLDKNSSVRFGGGPTDEAESEPFNGSSTATEHAQYPKSDWSLDEPPA